jgi:hypothetical protein
MRSHKQSGAQVLATAAVTQIDLKTVEAMSINAKRPSVLDINTATDKQQLKFRSSSEAERWAAALREWKDFAVDYADMYGSSDVESGSPRGGRGTSSSSRMKSTTSESNNLADDLNNIRISNMDDSPDSPPQGSPYGGATYNKMFGSAARGQGHSPEAVSLNPGSVNSLDKLEGWLEMRAGSKFRIGSEFKRRYCIVEEASKCLNIYKGPGTNERELISIDLRTTGEIVAGIVSAGTSKEKDLALKFSLDAGDKVYKFKAVSATDCERWVHGLNEWKDSFLMAMTAEL